MQEETFQQKMWRGTAVLFRSLKPLALYLCLPALLSCVGMALFRGRDAGDILARSGNFYYALGIVLTIVLLARSSRKRGSSIFEETDLELHGIDRRKLFLLLGMGIGFAVFFSAFLTVVPFPESLMESYRGSSDGFREGNDRLLAWISVIFMAPAAEEIVFRGYMLGRLLEGFETKTAVLISAGIFALCHVSLLWMVYAGIMGILLAWVSIREDNLIYTMALHVGFNASVIPVQFINLICGYENGVSQGKGAVALVGVAAAALALWAFDWYRKEKQI